jgi:hypothetical protein
MQIKFNFSTAALVNFEMDPPKMVLKAYESGCAVMTVTPKKMTAKLPTKIKEFLMVND